MLSSNCIFEWGLNLERTDYYRAKTSKIVQSSPTLRYLCILKNDRSFNILKVEYSHVSFYFPWLLCFPDFQILPDFGRSKSLGLFSTFLTKNWYKVMCHIMHHPNQKFSAWSRFDLVTLNNLKLTQINSPKASMVLTSVPDTMHAGLLAYFHLTRLYCAGKSNMTNRRIFWFWLCDIFGYLEITNKFPFKNLQV